MTNTLDTLTPRGEVGGVDVAYYPDKSGNIVRKRKILVDRDQPLPQVISDLFSRSVQPLSDMRGLSPEQIMGFQRQRALSDAQLSGALGQDLDRRQQLNQFLGALDQQQYERAVGERSFGAQQAQRGFQNQMAERTFQAGRSDAAARQQQARDALRSADALRRAQIGSIAAGTEQQNLFNQMRAFGIGAAPPPYDTTNMTADQIMRSTALQNYLTHVPKTLTAGGRGSGKPKDWHTDLRKGLLAYDKANPVNLFRKGHGQDLADAVGVATNYFDQFIGQGVPEQVAYNSAISAAFRDMTSVTEARKIIDKAAKSRDVRRDSAGNFDAGTLKMVLMRDFGMTEVDAEQAMQLYSQYE